MTTVLVADKFEKVGVDGLAELGCRVVLRPELTTADLPAAIRESDAKILVVRSTKVDAAALASGASLSLVIRAGAGIDTIDVPTASKLGVFISNCPGKNSIAVAELVMGLILSCDRRIPDQVADLRAGTWKKGDYQKARGLHGRILGVVGLGQIGQLIVDRARAFGMTIVAWSRQLTVEDAARQGIGYCLTPLEVARLADVVTLNVAATAETKQLVNAEFLSAMKPGAYLINTSRGTVVDEAALERAVREKGIRAGLDVFDPEPAGASGDFTNSIVQAPGVYGTHHVGASTDQAQVAIAHEVVRICKAYIETGAVPNCVNRQARSRATHVISVRHQNKPGVLAHVFAVLSGAGINVEEVENIIYYGALATIVRIHVSSEPPAEAMSAIRSGNEHIISVELSSIG
ncbi:MAG: NAD(P)-dependent oxidoreductase [Gemmatimonadales bacterium]